MHKALPLSLAAALLVTGSIVVAQSAERPAAGAEMTPEMAQDGAEHRAEDRAQDRAGRAFERRDADGHGALDAADRAARLQSAFERTDADKDGAVSLAEFQAAREGRRDGPREPRGDRRGRAGAGRLPGMHGLGQMARTADADADGTITRDEFQAAALARFEAADADDDGRLTRDERRPMRRPAG